ncbi:hypothetical protein D0X99_19875 [Algoriphagus lacus]|uniref:DUF3945 domain-containing protein n=1 Tax=Algoriphagus lacus TaxID=2056311 RepID=A0A418PLE5_9BACT|nr:hypothetical protein [Algoriphagus lacus]RIW12115.1 hypothetical protein D0X99_19875 [Algoriphagus lacus]
MDQENYEFLTEKLKYTGFEDKLNAKLKEEIKSGKENITLSTSLDIEGKKMDVDLYFKKSAISDRYFFNKFEASLRNENPELEPKRHTFYQNQGVTAKEAFNLLEGRAVFKSLTDSDKEPYKAWLQLDLSAKEDKNNFQVNQYHEKYGFNLEEALRKLPIKELKDDTKTEWMIKALQKGNTYPVVMERKGLEEVMFIEANPKFKSINVYDASMNSVKTSEILGKDQKKGEDQIPDELSGKKKDLKLGEKVGNPEPTLSQSVGKGRNRPRI